MKKSTQAFRDYLRVLEAQLSYAATSRALRLSQRGIFQWIVESKRAQSAGDAASIYLFKIDEDDPDEQPGWFHDFCRDVCSASIEEIESAARQRARDGVYQISKFQGRSVYKINPDLEALGFEGADAYERDESGKPVYEMVWTPPTNELVLGVLAAYSKRYKKQQQGGANVQVNVGGGVQVIGGDRPQIAAAAQPLSQVQVIEQQSEPAEFTELSIEEILGETLPDEPDDEPEPNPAGVAVIDAAAIASIGPRPIVPQGMKAEYDALVARGAIRADGSTVGTTVAPVVFSTTPAEYAPAPSAILSPRTPLNAAEIALLARLPTTTDRK